jgi:hypothetical protein
VQSVTSDSLQGLEQLIVRYSLTHSDRRNSAPKALSRFRWALESVVRQRLTVTLARQLCDVLPNAAEPTVRSVSSDRWTPTRLWSNGDALAACGENRGLRSSCDALSTRQRDSDGCHDAAASEREALESDRRTIIPRISELPMGALVGSDDGV